MFIEVFKNPGYQYAMLASVLWHLFWFFGLAVDVKAPEEKVRPDLKIHFLGPVLSDDAFNMIVATKPELSRTFYKSAETFEEALEPEAGQLDRRQPGDLLSVPLGRTTWGALRGSLPEEKPYAHEEFIDKFSIDIIESPFPVEGDLKDRDLFHLPDLPKKAPPLSEEMPSAGAAEFRVRVDAEGVVRKIENVISSGDPETDLVWQRYLKKWQFMPLDVPEGDAVQEGLIKVRYRPEERHP